MRKRELAVYILIMVSEIVLIALAIALLKDEITIPVIPKVVAEPIVYQETVSIEQEVINAKVINDDDVLAELCMGEAGNQPMIGKIAVIVTVLNRAEMFDMTIYEVATQKGQYDGYPYKGIITNECYEAVELARIAFDAGMFPKDMIYMRANKYHSFGVPYTPIGDHYFSTQEEVDNERRFQGVQSTLERTYGKLEELEF